VTGVRTDEGDVEAEIVVNCAGQWAKQVGAMCGVTVPLHSAEHFYVVTEQIDGVHRDLPILRDPTATPTSRRRSAACRRRFRAGRQAVGRARRAALPVRVPAARRGLGPLRDPDGERPAPDPGLPRRASRSSTTGRRASPRTISSSSARRLSCGTSSSARASTRSASPRPAERAGRWPSGSPRASRHRPDGGRHPALRPFNGNNQWLHDRVGEVLGLHYAVPWPNRELRPPARSAGRPLITC
jgi:hypothetical protein